MEPLGLAITQDKKLEGIQLGNATKQWEHRFSAFVDDSTIFFREGRHMERALHIVERFGQLSGLKMQPAKSQVILMETDVRPTNWYNVPVL